jgi:hypothetical protein
MTTLNDTLTRWAAIDRYYNRLASGGLEGVSDLQLIYTRFKGLEFSLKYVEAPPELLHDINRHLRLIRDAATKEQVRLVE